MKKFLNYLPAVLFLSLLTLASCGGDDDSDGDDGDGGNNLEEIATELTHATAIATSVNAEDGQTDLMWTEEGAVFEIKFSGDLDGGSYTTTNSKNTDVWPASGTWAFKDETGTVIVRDNTTDIDITVTETTLKMSFDYTSAAARTHVVDGGWVFNMDYTAQ
ncbi:hypothetical protein BFP72_11115 [Reichenbachiella sp. 5M10]|uniref:hypothetical protein n=1 Tax=Reichenbachiella sp. 5M10 TaxID=1889772 RepID=UPI000C15B115|nr:hypothetical protein [Reichenbachiella sp. 5M10]PIB35902.1 hypothetical protein BFP72_11115 [Reichenbachiella sp. 5M10]